ncbi:MAG: hypothetical protein ABL983_07825 [Nitrospira sp.]|jgi:hypothetical protein
MTTTDNIDLTKQSFDSQSQDYVRKHGPRSLSPRIYKDTAVKINDLWTVVHGQLVIVKDDHGDSLCLIIASTLQEFTITNEQFETHCSLFFLDDGLALVDPKEWERQANLLLQAYKACGLSF